MEKVYKQAKKLEDEYKKLREEINKVPGYKTWLQLCYSSEEEEEPPENDELGLGALEFKDDLRILLDPDIWIADSGATVHTTPHKSGIYNEQKSNEGVTVGNGVKMTTEMTGMLTGMMVNKNGFEIEKMTMPVSYTPGGTFNLFSVTSAMTKGWVIRGSSETGIILSKGNHTITFDIPITTKNGVVYCMCLR